VNILSVVAVFGLVCLAFLGYGIGLLVVTRRAMNTRRKLKFYLQAPNPTPLFTHDAAAVLFVMGQPHR
jgi:hypothetical protein